MKKIIEIIGHGMEPERAECKAKEIHEHYMNFANSILHDEWEVDKDCQVLPIEEQYQHWSDLPENQSDKLKQLQDIINSPLTEEERLCIEDQFKLHDKERSGQENKEENPYLLHGDELERTINFRRRQ